MTSWPDQPPQTRRQARENQRAAERDLDSATPEQPKPASRRAATVTPTPAGEVPDVATPYSFASAARDSSSRAGGGQTDAPPLRPRTPRYENLSFDTLLAASHAGGPAGATPAEERPAERSAVAVAPVPSNPGSPEVQPPSAPFASQQSSPAATAAPYANDEAARQSPPAMPTVSPVDGHPLTRRELRAMLQAQAANQAVQGETAPDARPEAAESDQATSGRGVSTPVVQPDPFAFPPSAPSPVVTNPERTVESGAPVQAGGHDPFVELISGAASGSETPSRRVVPPASPTRHDDNVSQTPITAVPATSAGQDASPVTPISPVVLPEAFPDERASGRDALAAADSSGHEPGVATDPQLSARGAGHWSTMNEDDDTGGIPRSAVSTGSVTTANALILPSIPTTGLATSPLTSTGEVMVTGSIDLPKSLGATGQHPDHFDSSDIDRLFEESDAAPATSGVAPVRASKAVATHTSTRGMITPPKARGNKLPVVLAVTAAFLAVGVAALLVAGFAFHAF